MTPVRWPWRRERLPPPLSGALQADERVLAMAALTDGDLLAASRFGLWYISGADAVRWGWDRISKAVLKARTLTLTVAAELELWPDGTVVLTDAPVREFTLAEASGLTDIVHARVRRSVVASEYLPWTRSGGWVVLRRVPGIDGTTTQVRLDHGADPEAPGFAAAVAHLAGRLADPAR